MGVLGLSWGEALEGDGGARSLSREGEKLATTDGFWADGTGAAGIGVLFPDSSYEKARKVRSRSDGRHGLP